MDECCLEPRRASTPRRSRRPRSILPSSTARFLLTLSAASLALLLVFTVPPARGLRCYVCGGHSGKACLPILDPEGDLNGDKEDKEEDGGFFSSFSSRRSPYVRPPTPPPDGKSNRQWEECNDLINHKGCMKQVVNEGELDSE